MLSATFESNVQIFCRPIKLKTSSVMHFTHILVTVRHKVATDIKHLTYIFCLEIKITPGNPSFRTDWLSCNKLSNKFFMFEQNTK